MNAFVIFLLRIKYSVLSYFSSEKAVKSALALFFTPRRHPLKPIEEDIKKKANKAVLKSGTVYYSWGEGKPVVFLHGWEGRATQVSSILAKLGSEYQVIAIDAPAHGESEGEISHPKMFVDALYELLEEIGPVHAIIGHSMGGGSALYAASKGVDANKIVSIAGPSNFLHVVNAFATFIGLKKEAKSRFLSEVEAYVGIPYVQLNSDSFLDSPTRSILLLHDEDDVEVSVSHAKAFDTSLGNVRVEISRGLGHRKILYSKETVEAIARFL
jgi:hypothetical protein